MSPILACGDPVTVVDMSLRRVVEDLLGADGSGADRVAPGDDRASAALEAAGHGDLGAELYGEALVHFADTAPLEQAEALSTIVTEASAVPIDPELDPPTSEGETIDDVEPVTDGAEAPDLADEDPDVLDNDLIEAPNPAVDGAPAVDDRLDTDDVGVSGAARSTDGFGAGAAGDPAVDTPSDAFDRVGEDGADADLDGTTPLAVTPDPLDALDAASADGPGDADLLDDLDLVDDTGDEPDLLLDE